MVSVHSSHTLPTGGDQPDFPSWLESLGIELSPQGRGTLLHACEFAQELNTEDPDAMRHVLGTAVILAHQNLDQESIVAAILQGAAEHDPEVLAKVAAIFGEGVARLVDGVARMGQISEYSAPAGGDKREQGAHIESLRKMLLAMVEDIRVVLIKLAERTQAMRELSHADEDTRHRVAHEVQDIFAPLANRLGVWQVKWELEDLSFRYLEPDLYKKIARLLDEKRLGREQYIADVREQLRQELHKNGVVAEVSGRPKHIYSIYKKMKRKGVDFSEVYDVRAVRVLVNDLKDCYTALGVVHSLWQPIPGEFDDYIAHPKGNDYRSLHTAVVGPEEKALEVQIRTHDMHNHAELGVAAHWRYKEGGRQDAGFEEKIAWLRQIMEWKEDVHDAGELMEQFKTGLFQDTVYILTPQGKVVALSKGATPIDFAYHVHTDLGDRCRGAKVDGNIVPLTYPLQNGQRVEIITVKQGGPSRDWLNFNLGYVRTSRAKAKIRHWFKHQHYEENVAQGREALEKETHRLGLPLPNLETLAQKNRFARPEDLLAAIGRGDITARQVMAAIQEEVVPKEEEWHLPAPRAGIGPSASGVLLHGEGGMLTTIAKCCKPVPPDAIIGFVTRGRGVAIHRQDCPNVLHFDESQRDRLLVASWGTKSGGHYEVDIEIEANDRQGLLRDVSEVMTREKINVTAVSTLSRGLQAGMRFTVQIADLDQLARIIAQIREVPGVAGAWRRS
ncbi:(p)ppGpp synthetase I SpoT/RelA [Sulfuricella denitrificans skB26]|uniref:GTP pyrophosphokinase n=1 Tax=Sulfuricella denitrificans (strain DSM 22764 / NBRC 105220 / skB26) TaxID=1163617 RepID=S6A9Y9_SULDS|nr:bifunctional (p)ppGpp synthetase/guanosine-3',5'-bis(diphosphate) 3'-pyrophosphohydrolase [Sulfuricella denitrificans]BAN34940.1 (p)ppGpp synthetase I SpoT/RelA [Sulfuricella denitrificans skB26]